MGRRGPPPKPTKLRIVEGNPGKRPINDREPQPRRTLPRCPSWLDKEAKKVWRRLAPELRRMDLLTVVDGDALAGYCQAYAHWRRAEEFLQQHGDVYPLRDNNGKVRCMQPFPQVAIARSALMMMRNYQQEFGLTPSARTRIMVEPEEEWDALDEFLATRKGQHYNKPRGDSGRE